MELKDLKYLPKAKRLTMANCVLSMIFADGKEADSEWNVAANILTGVLEITAKELDNNVQNTAQIEKTLRTMSGEELAHLGILLGVMSKADGVIAKKELDLIRGILALGGLRSDNIEQVIEWVRKLK